MTDRLHLTRDHVLDLLRNMLRIRSFENKCAELYTKEKIRGFLHLYDGQEAIAAGIIPHLSPVDRLVTTYREHGHALVRGVPMNEIMAELYGRTEGCSGGRGGSMHLFSAAANFYGGNAIVGAGLPLATGLALADHMQKEERVTVCFFGEGAVAEGEFHESLNLAALWKLPVLFVCENNLYAMGTALSRSESMIDLRKKAESYGIEGQAVDGMDVVAIELAARRALDGIRLGATPFFLECKTYRFRAHSMFDAQLYRSKEEVEAWRPKGPIRRLQSWAEENGIVHLSDVERLQAEIDVEIAAAVDFAENGTDEEVTTLERHVYGAALQGAPAVVEAREQAVTISYREAVRLGLERALERDPRVFLMGEDVGRYGGGYGVSKGLLERFGEERIRDTPLSESGFTGAGIGAAVAGMRPVVEIMTVNFSLLALDQILNTAATLRHMSNGQFSVPLVIRLTTGAGRQLAAQHSHSLEGWFAHIPGLKVLAPATLEDAYGMLWSAIEDPDPVLIFENIVLYNRTGPFTADGSTVGISQAVVRRQGSDISLITYGGSLFKTLEAAERLEDDGIYAEVIDLRSLRPLDDQTILASVAKTHRVLIIDEGWRSGSLAAEIGMRIAEGGFFDLDAPLARICSAEVPIPYPRHLEYAAIPQTERIVGEVRRMLRRG